MAHAGGQEVFVIAGVAQQEHAHIIHKVRVGADVEIEIAAHAAARIDTDGTRDGFRWMACLLHRLPSHFKEFAVLGVKDGGIFGGKAKEISVERVKVFQYSGGRNVVFARDVLRRFASGQQLFLGQAADGFHAVTQVCPIAVYIGSSGHVHTQTNDCNIIV